MDSKEEIKKSKIEEFLKAKNESDFYSNEIYQFFRSQYIESNLTSKRRRGWRNYLLRNKGWKNFINSKELGIVGHTKFTNLYKIVDEKKWLINKIKYGF